MLRVVERELVPLLLLLRRRRLRLLLLLLLIPGIVVLRPLAIAVDL